MIIRELVFNNVAHFCSYHADDEYASLNSLKQANMIMGKLVSLLEDEIQ